MRIFMIAAVGLVLAGCTTTPDRYAAQLPHDDPKYNTAECKEIRLKALEFDNKVGSRMAIGIASGLLLGPFGIPIAAAADAEREDARRLFAREVHLRCSSKPLPKNLEIKPPAKPKPGRTERA
ncbi:hypothetical protein GOL41_17150 [Sinorhizobium medicae]|uniref:hypothetical protein n=1 Tax=Sinorhizobium medicae TaxID=110321 RepID=UPI000C7DF7F6|nr:hypothetical protein [Sinorhizobium medicae]MBO1939864.1 hypothetical protein [Sinorhizobium medicae]MDX0487228.1 hypothetical protein [Sinorhizobium medicae]MDX0488730.1 hypothetical protein [Sinorhizobium medicae]MDX0497668.1 hypothetical protein [Sinorhizobium medicae]MDX0512115.1 hypothetical protein [Sinorhizobium medicae]